MARREMKHGLVRQMPKAWAGVSTKLTPWRV
jgi:hypothetical protein